MKIMTSLLCLIMGISLMIGSHIQAQDASQSTTAEYRLRQNDMVDVKVYQQDDLETTTRVSADGTIKLPLIGSVKVLNRTPDEAAASIQELLSKKYVVNPQATVTVVEFAKRNFTVLGEVQHPGVYDIPDLQEMTLLEAIGLGGGYTKMANMSDIRIKRKLGEKWVIYRMNGKRMAEDNSTFEIEPNDIIIVGERLL